MVQYTKTEYVVSILVLVDAALRQDIKSVESDVNFNVSILVLVDAALRQQSCPA